MKLRKWDSAEHLKLQEDMAPYLDACIEEAGDDTAFIAKALGNVACAKDMTQLAKGTGTWHRTRGSPSGQDFLLPGRPGAPSR